MEAEMRRAIGHYGRLLKEDNGAGSRKNLEKRRATASGADAAQTKKKSSSVERRKEIRSSTAPKKSSSVERKTDSRPTVSKSSRCTSSLPFPRVSSTPRPVEVVRYIDAAQSRPRHPVPVENRKAFLSSKVSDLYQERSDDSSEEEEDEFSSRRRRKRKRQGDSDSFDFEDACNDIHMLVDKAGGTKDVAKRYGFATSSKPVKMPYKMLMRVNKYRKEREKETAELMRLSQIGTTSKRKKDRKQRQKMKIPGRGRWKEMARPLNPSIGKFHKGVQHIKTSEIQRLQQKGKRR